MILHKLILNNFGLFRGSQSIHLTPKNKKPIVLIGGMNGSGKTTLLDAVRLCLYGKRSLGQRVSEKEYYEYLSTMIHRSTFKTFKLNHASILLEFEYARDGEKKLYRVERSWQQKSKSYRSIHEHLSFSDNGNIYSNSDESLYQGFINELVPVAASQFFFFDGEKIQKLIDDSSHDLFLAESVKTLLGLNFVERLKSDLRLYANRLAKRDSPTCVQEDIKTRETEITSIKESLTKAESEKEVIQTKIEKLEAQITRQESCIADEGGIYAQKSESLKIKHDQLLVDIQRLENEIRDLCEGLFPFSLVPELLEQLKGRLLKEIKLDEWEAESRVLNTQNTELLKTLDSATSWNDVTLNQEQIEAVHNKLAPILNKRIKRPTELRGFKKVRDRSPSEYANLLDWIDSSLTTIPQDFINLSNAVSGLRFELKKVEADLQRAPEEEMLKPMIDELSELNQKLGQFIKQAHDVDESINSLTYQLKLAERKLEKLQSDQFLQQVHIKRQEQVNDVQLVLSEYSRELTQSKITSLSTAILDSFNQLSHKTNRIRHIEIDPYNFAVTLYDTNNRPISKEELSAGEKQIYTTALLWGLAKTSGKPLPMILDTPLGRLDTNHRELLVKHYFPFVSHQVVLLSTDTEIGEHLRLLLKPHTSHTFHLAYQNVDECSTIEDGYFSSLP